MVHTKALAVDGCWAYVGTGNFDPLSLRKNHEVGVVIETGPVIAEMEQRVFRADFRPEWEMHERLHLSLSDYFDEVIASCFL